MRNTGRRGLAAALALAAALTMAVPAAAADPLASGGFAEVRISAEETDVPETELSLSVYQRGADGAFRVVDELNFVTPVNRVTKDAEFHLTPQTQQVTLSVDYLTDLNGDGVYELLSGQDKPAGDVLTASGALSSASSQASDLLTAGKTYTLTASALLKRGEAAIRNRVSSGTDTYLADMAGKTAEPESILYLLTVSYASPDDQTDYELCYYLRLYDDTLPAPSAADYRDVAADAWYYGAVDYVVSRGILSGTTRSTFSPEQNTSRAMLAQTLYQVSGEPESGMSHFSDVPDDAWSYEAVSWAAAQGIMSGKTDTEFAPDAAVTRQELALVLYRYAEQYQLGVRDRADISGYADADQVADWARTAMEWAVGKGLLSGRQEGGTQLLAAGDTVTRAEFSAVLKTLNENFLP